MAGMENLTQSMPNPVGGSGGKGGAMGGKPPGPSPEAKKGISQAVQEALGKQQGGGPAQAKGAPGGGGPAKGPAGPAGGPGGPRGEGAKKPEGPGQGNGGKGTGLEKEESRASGGAFGQSPPEAKGGGGRAGTGDDYDPQKQKQVFMQMMVAQLEHQDPLNPTEGTEFTSQLAEFTGVEQQIRSNEHLKQLSGNRDDQQRWNAMSLLGRNVVLDRNSLQLGESPGKQQFQFQVDEPAEVAAQVTDAKGNVVKEIDLGKREAGTHKASWDGTNGEGKPVDAGEYTIRAVPARGEGGPYQTQVQATVQEVKMGDKGVQLGIGQGQEVPFGRVQTVSM